MKQTEAIQIAILAGGQNKRFRGKNKALMLWNGVPLLQVYLEKLRFFSDDIFVISNTPESFHQFGVPVYPDIIKGRGPLSGINSALKNAWADYVFIIACDMPLFSKELIPYLVKNIRIESSKVLIPVHHAKVEPLISLWPVSVLPLLEEWMMLSPDNKVMHFLEYYHLSEVVHVPDEIAEGRSFININTPEDLDSLLLVAGKNGGDSERSEESDFDEFQIGKNKPDTKTCMD